MYPFDPNQQQMYEQYLQAHRSGDHSQIDPTKAYENVQQFFRNAPPEMQQQVYQQHFEQMPYEQRQQYAQQMPPPYQAYMDPNDPQRMAQGFQQMGQQQPGLLQQILGGLGGQSAAGGMGGSGAGMGGLLSNPMAKTALVGLAGVIAGHLLGGHRGGFGGGGFGGGMFGGDRDDRGDWGDGGDGDGD
jgi:hypothetical protein